ncbi:hypothetical protein U14_05723 [Candidatus Moduliflexus flocculans]|uniref:DUF7281 domain-containing protein n=1 Tax=Candidatus Moduliflexus flocculans TaxID=1499966 RepID=A0A081BSQ7_9BACT|nr:hypothetical protein U14_05723 [Candidatus Moduliflexus flocculans]
MTLSLQFAKVLLELLEQKQLPYSRFSQQVLLKQFQEDGIITISGRRQKIVQMSSSEILQNYLENHFGITNLTAYIAILSEKTSTRADLVKVASDSKIQQKKVFEGFLVNCYKEIYGYINNEKILLKPIPGSFVFINDYEHFRLESDVTIVVVENFENFKRINEQKALFAHIKSPLFVSRYWGVGLGEWLSHATNDYIHFGDFDLSGLKIYIQEFRNKRTPPLKSNFLIPSNIEIWIERYGNRDTYLAQLENTEHIDFNQYPEITKLAKIIKQHQKSLHQEFFIKFESISIDKQG